MFAFTWSALKVLGGPLLRAFPPSVPTSVGLNTLADGIRNWPLLVFACSSLSAAESICDAVTHGEFPGVPQFNPLAKVASVPALRSFDRQVAGVGFVGSTHGTFTNSVEPFVASVTRWPW